jgi:hypothetical protein
VQRVVSLLAQGHGGRPHVLQRSLHFGDGCIGPGRGEPRNGPAAGRRRKQREQLRQFALRVRRQAGDERVDACEQAFDGLRAVRGFRGQRSVEDAAPDGSEHGSSAG